MYIHLPRSSSISAFFLRFLRLWNVILSPSACTRQTTTSMQNTLQSSSLYRLNLFDFTIITGMDIAAKTSMRSRQSPKEKTKVVSVVPPGELEITIITVEKYGETYLSKGISQMCLPGKRTKKCLFIQYKQEVKKVACHKYRWSLSHRSLQY